jgi:HlyD family secretion protein
MKRKNKLVILSVIVVIAIIVVWVFISRSGGKTIQVETGLVRSGNIINTITATGTIEPITQVLVGTQVSGVIQHLYVDYNSTVKKGQLIAILDKNLLNSQLVSAKASLESAQNELQFQTSNYNRFKVLYDKKSISQSDYDNALYTYNNARSGVDVAKSNLDRAQINLNYADIYSPIDGVVISKAVDEGQTVAASFNTPTLFTIANDLTKMQVVADVDEADIGQVKDGQKVTFSVDAYPDDEFTGKVTQIRLEPKTTANVVTYSVVVEAPNPDLKLMPGMTASINVLTREADSVLTVPAKALRFQPVDEIMQTYFSSQKNGRELKKEWASKMAGMKKHDNRNNAEKNEEMKTVWVKDGGNITPHNVKTGITDGTETQIIQGLQPGDLVVTNMEELSLKEAGSKSTNATERSPFMPHRPTPAKTK